MSKFQQTFTVLSCYPYYHKDAKGQKTGQIKGHVLQLLELSKNKEDQTVGEVHTLFPSLEALSGDVAGKLFLWQPVNVIFETMSGFAKPTVVSVNVIDEKDLGAYDCITFNTGKKL